MDGRIVKRFFRFPQTEVSDSSLSAAEQALMSHALSAHDDEALTFPDHCQFDSEEDIEALANGLLVWEDLEGALRLEEPEQNSRFAWARASQVVALAACAAFVVLLANLIGPDTTSYSTEIGEQRTVQLEDGTNIILNTNSKLDVRYDDSLRRVSLERGEAMFGVTHDADRPFIVKTQDQVVEALGTSFIVRNDLQGIEVTLLSGVVRVSQGSGSTQQSVLLEPGERLRDTKANSPEEAGNEVDIDRPVLEVVTAWRKGDIYFDETALSEAVEEVNRYSRTPISLTANDAADRRITGVVRINEVDAFVTTVADMYGLQVEKTDHKVILSEKRE
ncbi:MAG: FecR domain-containing protein [Hyphomonadaceae bacterium]|nr:FecR domain-containing protein [Hyphomonadaceae bacterium]